MSLLCDVLSDPNRLPTLTEEQWDTLIPLARYSKLLGTLDTLCEAQQCSPPKAAKALLRSETTRIEFIQIKMRQELREVAKILAEEKLQTPVILLKGSAYLLCESKPHHGRRFNDIDILVNKPELNNIEQAFVKSGWSGDPTLTAYDQSYYRRWMHELPPLKHPERGIELDLHHNLTPPVSRLKIPAEKLFEAAVPINNSPFFRLCDEDQFLHSAVHLLFNDELRGGLRDLWDLHLLLNQFALSHPNAVLKLRARACELNLCPAFDLAVLLLHEIFKTPVELSELENAYARCRSPVTRLTLYFAKKALMPTNRSALPPRVAIEYLYMRSHLLRMPPLMLARHLLTKFIQTHWPH